MRRLTFILPLLLGIGLGLARAAVAEDYQVGYAAHLRGEFEAAVESYTRAIESGDLSAEERAHVHYNRGNAHSALGEQRLALEDFDRALELAPGLTRAVYSRGVVRFYLGEFAEAASDLDRALEREPENAYWMIWRYLARAHSADDAREELARNVSAVDLQQWPEPLIAFLLGDATLKQVVAATQDADFEKQVTKSCEAAYYVGQQFLVEAKPEQARRWLGTAVVTCHPPLVEFAGAHAALARLENSTGRESAADDQATPPVLAGAGAPERQYEVTANVNYRDGPGMSHARLGVLPAGTRSKRASASAVQASASAFVSSASGAASAFACSSPSGTGHMALRASATPSSASSREISFKSRSRARSSMPAFTVSRTICGS